MRSAMCNTNLQKQEKLRQYWNLVIMFMGNLNKIMVPMMVIMYIVLGQNEYETIRNKVSWLYYNIQ